MSTQMFGAAQPLLQHQFALSERLKGPEHEETLSILLLLAKASEQQGDRTTAEQILRRAQASFERTLGSTHLKSMVSLYSLFEILSESPEPNDAGAWGEKLVSISQQVNGPSHLLTISAVKLVAHYYGNRQDFEAGIVVVRQALAALPHNESPPGLARARLQSLLAVLLDLAEKIDEAEVLGRSSWSALHKHLGPDHPETDQAFRHSGDLTRRLYMRTPWGRFRLRSWGLLAKLAGYKHQDHNSKTA